MTIHEISTDTLKEYKNNPRDNEKAVDAVAASIREFGFKVPIVIDRNYVIIAGHTRLKAAKKLKMDKVPCIIAEDLTPEQIKAFRLADNKTAELAEWDFGLLEQELNELSDLDFDMQEFGFEILDSSDLGAEIEEDEVPEINEESEPITKRGDIWKLGNHYLMCGDSTSKSDVSQLMAETKVDLLLTDPPYNVDYEGGTDDALKIENDNMSTEDFKHFLSECFAIADQHMKEGACFYIWHASRTQATFESAIPQTWTIRQQLIWNKNAMVLGRQDYQWKHEPCFYGWKDGASHKWYSDRSQTTVLDFNKPNQNGEHPTMKPVELIAYQMQNSSKKGDTILDLFGGSGTTLIAAEQTERHCRMVELDPRYCDVIIKRWETMTGEKAELIEGTE